MNANETITIKYCGYEVVVAFIAKYTPTISAWQYTIAEFGMTISPFLTSEDAIAAAKEEISAYLEGE